RDEEMPAMSSVLSLLADDNKAGFRSKYALAREIQADGFFDDMVEIADDRADDWIEKKNANAGWLRHSPASRWSRRSHS
ncbi:terminase small subunit protein, partial [Rhizobium ruizarguesonis]